MKMLLGACAALILALTAVTAFAATDVTGSWTTQMAAPSGESMQITFTFKQDGTKVTGSVVGPQGNPIDISNGKIDGDKLSFDTSFQGMTIHHIGTATGEEIKLSVKSDDGQMPPMDMTLKRAK